jgi:uncharacterized DUF497 family protein
MRFQYDPAKAAENLEKHGVSFADAEGVFHDSLALSVEDADARGEQPDFRAPRDCKGTEAL